ncbi:hypothetical protein Tco_0665274 [Tanacetum coccineum]
MAFVSGSPPVKKARTEGVVISDSWPSTADKSLTALRMLIRQSGQAGTGSESAAPATEDATSSSVTPTPEHASEGVIVLLACYIFAFALFVQRTSFLGLTKFYKLIGKSSSLPLSPASNC